MKILEWFKNLFSPSRPAKTIDEIVEEAKKEKESKELEEIEKALEEKKDEEVVVEEKEEVPEVEETLIEEAVPVIEEKEIILKMWNADYKEIFASLLRPIVKKFNKDRKEEYSSITSIPEEDLKLLKVYGSIEDEGTALVFKFTQSDNYNKKIQNFVNNTIATEFMDAIEKSDKLPEDMELDFELEDGKIKITEEVKE